MQMHLTLTCTLHVCTTFELRAVYVGGWGCVCVWSVRHYKSSAQPRSERQVTQVKPPTHRSERSAAGAYATISLL